METLGQFSLLRSVAIQFRVIGALVMREVTTRYGRHNIGFMWLFVEPMMFTLGIAALQNALKSSHGVPITTFAVTGYSTILLWRNTVSRCSQAITPNISLMYHRNVRVLDIFVSRIILESAGATISFFVLSAFFIFVGESTAPVDILKVLFGWVMVAWFGASLALVVGSLSERFEVIEKLWHPVSYILFPLSGALFLVEWLPKAAREVVLWLPMVHGVEIIREGYFGNAMRAYYDISYMAATCLCLTLLGLALAKDVGRRVQPQ
jgi:capsular polysaccharide transport system permease protein